jgi:DNA-binding transcriptional MocR family regulator
MSQSKRLSDFTQIQLSELHTELNREYELIKGNPVALNLSRGKPAADQVALSDKMEDVIAGDYFDSTGTDVRNYGEIRGIADGRALGEELMGVPAANIIAGGNSSLFLMHLVTATALTYGLWGDQRRWSNSNPVKILAPAPGYDRHFALTQSLGIEMIPVPMGPDGPDMAQARTLASADASIKGIWCVPKYSNPTGCIYSDVVVDEMAALPDAAAADDFVVLWDNAYAVHDFNLPGQALKSIFDAAQAAGTADHIVQFASTSKITFAGGGVAFVASSERVLKALEERLGFMMIGPDKVNQLRHARFLGGRLDQHMQAHAALLKPKFEIVEDTLSKELGDLDIAQWTKPDGGYFVSLDVNPGLAQAIVSMAKDVGLTLTPAGATYPYGQDPDNCNIRIAPTFASIEELRTAMQILTLCVKLVSVREQMKS